MVQVASSTALRVFLLRVCTSQALPRAPACKGQARMPVVHRRSGAGRRARNPPLWACANLRVLAATAPPHHRRRCHRSHRHCPCRCRRRRHLHHWCGLAVTMLVRQEALGAFEDALKQGVVPDADTYRAAIRACKQVRCPHCTALIPV
jgi:hypothetical protein